MSTAMFDKPGAGFGPETIFAAQTGSLLFGGHIGGTFGWTLALVCIAGLALVGWKVSYGRTRTMADLPTSRVASAAQGYVELHGEALWHEGHRMIAPRSRFNCVWYRFLVEEKKGKNWRKVESGVSSETFVLRDASGDCVIDPEGAEVLTSSKRTWFSEPYRITEWLIRPGDAVYALGAFVSIDPADPNADAKADTAALLAEWKRDRRKLLERFDTNRDGEIDMQEWERVRAAAAAEVSGNQKVQQQLPQLHMMRKPKDGRAYMLSNIDPNSLIRRYRMWTMAQLGIFCVAGGFAAFSAVKMHWL
jgi:hypothetical protein